MIFSGITKAEGLGGVAVKVVIFQWVGESWLSYFDSRRLHLNPGWETATSSGLLIGASFGAQSLDDASGALTK
jgi:hypothetical protein